MHKVNNKNVLITIVCALVATLFLVSCSNKSDFSAEMPSNIPDTSNLVGGIDGWVWIDCKPSSKNQLTCQTYSDEGELLRTSYLQLCLNLSSKYRQEEFKVAEVNETVFSLDNITFYEYRPSSFPEGKDPEGKLAQKYYSLLGVNSECGPVGSDSDLLSSE